MVTSERLERGVTAGLTAAAAVTGAILAFAWRAGAPLEPLVSTGRAMLEGGTPAMALIVGIVTRLADGVLWGLLLAVVAGGVRDWRVQLLSAIAVSAVAAGAHATILVPLRLGYGVGVFPLHGTPLLYLYLVFAVGLLAGMRITR